MRIYSPVHGPSHNVVRQNCPDAYIALPIGLRNYVTMFESYMHFGNPQTKPQNYDYRIRCFWKEPPIFPNTCLPTTTLPELGELVRNSTMYSETQLLGVISDDSKTHVDIKDFMVSILIPFCTSTPTHATSSTPRHAL